MPHTPINELSRMIRQLHTSTGNHKMWNIASYIFTLSWAPINNLTYDWRTATSKGAYSPIIRSVYPATRPCPVDSRSCPGPRQWFVTGCVPVPGDCLADPGSARAGIPNVYRSLTDVTGLVRWLSIGPQIRWGRHFKREPVSSRLFRLFPGGVLRGSEVRGFGNSNSAVLVWPRPRTRIGLSDPDPDCLSLLRRLPWWLAFPPTSG